MKRPLLALLAGPCLLAAFEASGQDDAPRQDLGSKIMREQMERERERLLRQESPPVEIAAPEDAWDGDPATLAEDGPSFPIDRILMQGDSPLKQRAFERLVAPFSGMELGRRRIGLLLNRLNQAMVEAGYITSRAYLSSQNLSSGTLTIVFVAGRIEAIRYNGDDLADAGPSGLGLRMALPMQRGDLLQLRDIEQGIDQINRIQGNQASVQIVPGEHVGGSIIEIANPRVGASRRYTVAADNQGSPGTGTSRYHASVEAGGLLGLMHTLSLGYTGSRDTNALYASWSLPLGYNTFSILSSWSEYQNLIGNVALVYGTSRSHAVAWNRLVHRDRSSKTAFDLSLTKRSSWRQISNVELTPQRLTVLRLGINRLSRFGANHRTGQWTLAAGYNRGLDWLDADRDPSGLPAAAARAQFSKVDLAASALLPFGDRWLARGNVAAQWTATPHFSSEQIFAGGVSSVRGLPESAVSGDRGAFVRSEVAYVPRSAWFDRRVAVEPYGFLDYGRVQTIADRRWREVASAGFGARLAWAGGMSEVTAGFPLSHPTGLARARPRLNASLVFTF